MLAALAGSAQAHPHVWIEASVALLTSEQKVTAVEVTWIFDDIYSWAVQEDFDADGSGELDEEELAALAEVSEENLAEHSFFTHLRIAGERQRVTGVEDFRASVEDERIVYRFAVPIDPPVDLDGESFAFALYDETYFVDVALGDEPIDVAGAEEGDCDEQRAVDRDQPLYFGLYFPTYVTVICQ